jgi:hypothetical protein
MVQIRDRPMPAKIYLREWMSIRDIPDQKRLAQMMGRAEGTVSKKLAKPETIDLAWLSEFAQAFGVHPVELFSDPSARVEVPPIVRPRLADLMKAAEHAEDADLDYLISFLSRVARLAPPAEPSPEHVEAQPTTSKSK